MIPQACTHNCLIFHSKFSPNLTAVLIFSSLLYIIFSSSFPSGVFNASEIFVWSGIKLENLFDLSKGTHIALAASLNAALVAIFIKVQIAHTFSSPYSPFTYSITLSLCVSSKSISKSGILTLAGFRNLSKSSPNGIGSISVIFVSRARSDPAHDHLPGHTTIQLSLARDTKSDTIRKYVLNHISLITLNSYSNLCM
jgi:hypothetical protein